ncbi:unnamed protein product [Spirodela intermedia]|uniref:LOB domain-containing protein n=1 Tax=Spirodela intermedia TaxID=51605 RepID=A0A7I8IK65_SPIIN|nr:unnamed protein product [Spirodela intermedia]CAA6658241.1 unnamed protein product [Spirodela intermedia]
MSSCDGEEKEEALLLTGLWGGESPPAHHHRGRHGERSNKLAPSPKSLNMSVSNSSTTTSSTSGNSHSPGPPHHHLHNQSRRSSTGGTGSGSPGSAASPTQACAACKYQRRKCNPDCTLAPYFPADHHRQFINAHRLFGVSNILKTLRGLDHPQRTWAMKNITFQSNMRSQDAVGGCYRIIFDIQRQIEVGLADQEQLVRYLALCRAQAQARVNSQPFLPDANVIGNPIADDHQLHQQQPFLYYCAGGGEASGSVVKTHEGGVDPPPSSSPLRLCGIDLGQDLQRPENDEGHHERLPLDMFELRNHQPTTFPAAIEEEDVQKGVSTLDFRSFPTIHVRRIIDLRANHFLSISVFLPLAINGAWKSH